MVPGRLRFLPGAHAGYRREGRLGLDAAFDLARERRARAA
jgi:hypothetical protein